MKTFLLLAIATICVIAGSYSIEVNENTFFEVYVNGDLKIDNMPKFTKKCQEAKTQGGIKQARTCESKWEVPKGGKVSQDSFSLSSDEEPHTIVIHGFNPDGTKEPSLKFSGEGVNSNAENFQCAANFATFWKDGKTMAPNYNPAFIIESGGDEASADTVKRERAQPMWVKNLKQHHVTCTWTNHLCSGKKVRGKRCPYVHEVRTANSLLMKKFKVLTH